MAAKSKQSQKSKNQPKQSSLRNWFAHGNGGHIVVISFVSLLAIGFLIYAAINDVLENYIVLIVLLVLTLLVQVILFLRIRNKS
jgi:hypothetical protein